MTVRLQLDYLYPMLVYAEAAGRAFLQSAAGLGSASFLGGTEVRLLFPPANDEVTSSLLFRSYTAYTGGAGEGAYAYRARMGGVARAGVGGRATFARWV